MRRSIPVLLTAGLLTTGAVFATASNLGGITSGSVGADNQTVLACDTNGVSTSYASAWDATDKQYEITSVTVNGLDHACDAKSLDVALTDSTGVKIGGGTVTVPTDATATTATVTLTAAASAKLTQNVHVAIA